MIKGPRQSGKTTLLAMIRQKLISQGTDPNLISLISFEERNLLEQFTKEPLSFIKSFLLPRGAKRYYIFLDEYQYVSNGGQKLKLIYDTFTPQVKILITGSSSLELTSSLAKFMVGRLLSSYLFPLSFEEFLLARDRRLYHLWQERNLSLNNFFFSGKTPVKEELEDVFLADFFPLFSEYITFGGYPAIVTEDNIKLKQTLLQNLIETYVDRDIIGLLKEESITEFRNLIRILAAQNGRLVNYQQLSSDSRLYYRKIKHFLSVLEETFLLEKLLPFSGNLTSELKKNPKIYFLDSGLRNALVSNFSQFDFRADRGELVEGFVLANMVYSLKQEADFLFWRTLAGAEVDFIIRKTPKIFPLEVKFQSLKKPMLGRSIYSFLKTYEPERFLILTKDFWDFKKIGKTKILFAPVYYFSPL